MKKVIILPVLILFLSFSPRSSAVYKTVAKKPESKLDSLHVKLVEQEKLTRKL